MGAALQEAQEPSAVPTSAQVSSNGETSNDGIKTRIREVIQASSFEWTTIGRIMKRTGLSHDVVTNICASMPDLEISRGKKTGDAIYKFKSSRT